MAKTLGRDNIIGSNVIVGRGFEFRARSGAEDYLVKWTGTTGTTKAKVAGDGTMKVYQDPTTTDDVTRAYYNALTFFPYAGGSVDGDIDFQSLHKITNLAAATADGDAVSRASADARFLKQTDAATTYLTQASAASNYLTQASAAGTYLTQASASTNYATKSSLSNYATVSQLSNYAPASGSANYAPASGSPYYAPSSGSGNYAPASGSANYLPKANPTFTGKLVGPCLRVNYDASPSVPVTTSTDTGITFNTGGATGTAGGIQMSNISNWYIAPDTDSACHHFIRNKTNGSIVYVPVFASSAGPPSELRLKNLLGGLEDVLSKMGAINPVYYVLKDDETQTKQLGLVIEDVEPVFPEVVHQSEGLKFLDYGRLVTVAIAAIKELTARVEALEARA